MRADLLPVTSAQALCRLLMERPRLAETAGQAHRMALEIRQRNGAGSAETLCLDSRALWLQRRRGSDVFAIRRPAVIARTLGKGTSGAVARSACRHCHKFVARFTK